MLHHSLEAWMNNRGIITGETTPTFYCTVSRSRHDAKAPEAKNNQHFAQILGMASPLSFHHMQNMLPRTFPQYCSLCILYYRSPYTPCLPNV
jgi:hypothetical protein